VSKHRHSVTKLCNTINYLFKIISLAYLLVTVAYLHFISLSGDFKSHLMY